MSGAAVPKDTTAASEAAAARRMGVQGGGVAGDPGATGRGGANTKTEMSSRLAGGASEAAGRGVRPLGTHEAPASGTGTGFGGTVGITATPSATPRGGGPAMAPSEGMAGFGGGASAGTGRLGAMQGTAGGEAMVMGGGVPDPMPVDRKQGF